MKSNLNLLLIISNLLSLFRSTQIQIHQITILRCPTSYNYLLKPIIPSGFLLTKCKASWYSLITTQFHSDFPIKSSFLTSLCNSILTPISLFLWKFSTEILSLKFGILPLTSSPQQLNPRPIQCIWKITTKWILQNLTFFLVECCGINARE